MRPAYLSNIAFVALRYTVGKGKGTVVISVNASTDLNRNKEVTPCLTYENIVFIILQLISVYKRPVTD